MQDGPICTRPSYVSLIPGGRQDFPIDPKGQAYRDQVAKEKAKQQGIQRVRRRPAV